MTKTEFNVPFLAVTMEDESMDTEGPITEYEKLRDEMAQRLDRVHQTMIIGTTAVLAAAAFGLSKPAVVSPIQIACLIQLLIIIIGLYVDENRKIVYLIGTYLAFAYESNKSKPRWHRMSRHFGTWRNDDKENRSSLLWDWRSPLSSIRKSVLSWIWKLTLPWGWGPKIAGLNLFFLTILNFVGLIYPNVQLRRSPQRLGIYETTSVFLCFLSLLPIFSLCSLKEYRDSLETEWKDYNNKFEGWARDYPPRPEVKPPMAKTQENPGAQQKDP